MIDPHPLKLSALDNVSVMAGEYLESLGKTDLATLSLGEWMAFLNVAVTAWEDGKQQAESRLREDLDRVQRAEANKVIADDHRRAWETPTEPSF